MAERMDRQHRGLMTSMLFGLLIILCRAQNIESAVTNITSADLDVFVDNGRLNATLTLTLSGTMPDVDRLSLQEGFLEPKLLTVMYTEWTSPLTVHLTLDTDIHARARSPWVPVKLLLDAGSPTYQESQVTVTRDSGFQDYVIRAQPKACSSIGDTVSKVVDITHSSQLEQLARQECTLWFGSLIIQGITLTQPEWWAAFDRLREIEGFLVIQNCTGMPLNVLVESLTGGVGTGAETATTNFEGRVASLVLQDNQGLTFTNTTDGVRTDATLRTFVERVGGQGAVVLDNNHPGLCLSDGEASPRWWGLPSTVLIREPLGSCGAQGCSLHTDPSSGQCVSWCSECQQSCLGRTVTDPDGLNELVNASCGYIMGSLTFSNLPFTSEELLEVFSLVTDIEGSLTISQCQDLVGLDFLRSLRRVETVIISDNDNLVDATLPQLENGTQVAVTDNRRLCEAALPFGVGPCGVVDITASIFLPGLGDFQVVNNDVQSALQASVTGLASSGAAVSIKSEAFTHPTTSDAGVLVNVTITSFASQDSWDMLFHIRDAVIGDGLRQALQSTQFGYAYVEPLSLLSFPRRQPPIRGGFNSGISLLGSRNRGTAILSWTKPAADDDEDIGGDETPTTFVVEYAQRPDPVAQVALADHLLESGLAAGSLSVRINLASGILASVFQFKSIDVGDAQTLSLPSCQIVAGGVVLDRDRECLVPERDYDIRITGYVSGQSHRSNVVRMRLPDMRTPVQTLSAGSRLLGTHQPTIDVNWEAPLNPDPQNEIVSYRLQIRYAGSGNGGEQDGRQLAEEQMTQLLARELFMPDGQRVEVLSTQTNATLSGCFSDFIDNTTHCISPWTAYRVSVTAIGTLYEGIATPIITVTAQAPPTAPTLVNDPDKSGTESLTLRLRRPQVATGVVTSFRISYRPANSIEQPQTFSYNVPGGLRGQVLFPNEEFEVQLPDLLPDTTYQVNISAVTSAGEGTPLALEAISTGVAVPSKMEAPIVSQSVDGYVNVSWTPPSPFPGPILRYELIKNFDPSKDDESTVAEKFIVYSGLELETSVKFKFSSLRVRAVTEAGAGPLSEGALLPASSAGQSAAQVAGIASGAVAGIVVVIAVTLIVVIVRRRAANLAKEELEMIRPEEDEWEFPRDQLQLGKKLGEGAFGVVCVGWATDIREFKGKTKVAVKQCGGTKEVKASDREEFVKEATLMKRFGDPWHRNVLRLLGVVTTTEPMYIITEFMANGDLREFLKNSRPGGSNRQLELAELVYMGSDVASGMAFLASLDFVHRDLAARNCLVSDSLTVKIADFGLSRDIHYSEYYRRNGEALLPVRWMAPEALCDGRFTINTDIWSMGIVLWEIITLGRMPYPNYSNKRVLEEVINGYRMPQPSNCPDDLYDIMWDCWQLGGRPSFATIEKRLLELARKIELGEVKDETVIAGSPTGVADEPNGDVPMMENEEYTRMRRRSSSIAVMQSGYLRPNGVEDESPPMSPNLAYAPMGGSNPSSVLMQSNSAYTPMNGSNPSSIRMQPNTAYTPFSFGSQTGSRPTTPASNATYEDMNDANVPSTVKPAKQSTSKHHRADSKTGSVSAAADPATSSYSMVSPNSGGYVAVQMDDAVDMSRAARIEAVALEPEEPCAENDYGLQYLETYPATAAGDSGGVIPQAPSNRPSRSPKS